MGIDGKGAGGFLGCLVVGGILIAVVFGALTLTSGIESSRADRAMAKASVEQARAGAIVAEAKADVEKKEIETSHELAMLVERNEQQLKALQENNRIFQEKLLMLTVIVEGMEEEKVDRLSSLLGLEGGGTSWLAIVLAAVMAVAVFLMLLWFWKFFSVGENLWGI